MIISFKFSETQRSLLQINDQPAVDRLHTNLHLGMHITIKDIATFHHPLIKFIYCTTINCNHCTFNFIKQATIKLRTNSELRSYGIRHCQLYKINEEYLCLVLRSQIYNNNKSKNNTNTNIIPNNDITLNLRIMHQLQK